MPWRVSLLRKQGKNTPSRFGSDKQRIERYEASPDLTPFYRQFQLEQNEMLLLEGVAGSGCFGQTGTCGCTWGRGTDDDIMMRYQLQRNACSRRAATERSGCLRPEGVADARERVLSSIVRRRGQPAFRQRLLAAYNGRCAITGCDVEAVLDAVAYRLVQGAGHKPSRQRFASQNRPAHALRP